MKKRKGLTIIEVVLAMLILSVLLVTYITTFGQNAIFVSKGKGITKDTFNYQDIMENNMVETKKTFIAGGLTADDDISVFSGYYQSVIGIKKVEAKVNDNLKYTAFVTGFEIKEPKSPKIDPFKVIVYDSEKVKEVFPWKDDNIRLVSEYELKDDPLIFENRIRWYGSNDGEDNPVFASDYQILSEEEIQEPENKKYINELPTDRVKAGKFYHFEARPYTFAGRIEHYRNEDRILVLNRAGSPQWQAFMEDVYYKNNRVKDFTDSNISLYQDIMQNPNHPTLNLDWSKNSNPEGALMGIKLLDEYKNEDIRAIINFKFDETALNSSTDLGIGLGLINENNSGIIIDLEPLKEIISVKSISNGKYRNERPIEKIDVKDKDGGLIDWSKEYKLFIEYQEEKFIIKLKNTNGMDDIIDPLEIDLENNPISWEYIGLKSYSNIDYIPNLEHEIFNKYFRNYSSHFYDIEIEKIDSYDENDEKWTDAKKDLFYNGDSHTIKGGTEPNLKIRFTRKNSMLAGNRGVLLAKGFWFSTQTLELDLKNHPLVIKSEEVRFDVPIEFDKNSKGIEISGIDKLSYPVKVSFREGEKVRINNNTIITLKKRDYVSIKSGLIKLTGENDVICIGGSDFEIIKIR